MPTPENYKNGPAFECDLELTHSQTAFTDLYNPAPGSVANSYFYDPVISRYTLNKERDGDPFEGSARALNPAERVTLTGYTFTRIDEHTLTTLRSRRGTT